MSRLFIETYLDENVHVAVADILRSRGFKAVTSLDAGNNGKTDPEQLIYAAKNQFALITHNRVDFKKLAQEYFADGKTHFGIVIAGYNSPKEIFRRLFDILRNVTSDEMINQIRYI